MPRFLIEIRHPDDKEGCLKALDAIMKHGSHLVTKSEFGCEDDVHTGWLIVDADNHEGAKQLIPPEFRSDARTVHLRRWSQEEIREMVQDLSK